MDFFPVKNFFDIYSRNAMIYLFSNGKKSSPNFQKVGVFWVQKIKRKGKEDEKKEKEKKEKEKEKQKEKKKEKENKIKKKKKKKKK